MSENEISNTGGRVGPRIARLATDALIYTRQKLGPHQAALAQVVLADFTNHVSDEIRGVMAPIWKQFADDTNTPEELRPLFSALANERGQAWAWIAGQATGAATGAGIGDLFSNFLAPVIQPIIASSPNGLLSPEASAASISHDLLDTIGGLDLLNEAARGGLDNTRMRFLIELSRSYPTVSDLVTLLNHREIDRDIFDKTLKRLGYTDEWIRRLRTLSKPDETLPDISAMWNRGVLTDEQAIILGARLGYDATQVKRALEIGGEPPSPGELGEAFRRGLINEERYRRGIAQGPLRAEWFDLLAPLQFQRMSTIDAASAVTQGHLSEDEGRKIAHENGLVPDDFSTLIEIAGRPPGVEFAQEALNRGLIDLAQFRTMFLESSLKNRYLPLLEQMRIRLIPQETARLLYREGVYARDDTLDLLMKHGFSASDAAALVSLEDARRDGTTKELTRAQIVDLYEERIIDESTVQELLIALGYSEENVALMVALADIKRTQKFINAAISRVRSAFITGKIDDIEASAQLDHLQLPSAQRDELITIWDIDRTTVSKTLTPAQIRQALKKGFIDQNDAMVRLTSQGYDETDASLFLQLTA